MAKPQGITTAMIKNVAANPGIKIDALHAAIEMLIPGVSLKQVMDISYVTKVIKRVGRGKDAALYLADSVSQPTKKLAPKKPPSTVPAPVAAKQQIVFDPEYRFAFGIRKDGGIAICKDGVSMVLSHNEAQTILAHSSGASHE